MTISCSQCGTSFPDDFIFCLTCGKRLKEGVASPAPSEAGTATSRAGAEDRIGRSPSVQEELPAPAPRKHDPTASDQVIDEGEYAALMERVQTLRTEIWSLPRPTDVDPWRFVAVFDRVHLKPGFVPDFTFEAVPDVAFGPRAWSELSQGSFTLTTRRAIWPPFSWGPPGQFMARLLPRQASRGCIRRHTHNPVFRPKRLQLGLRLQQGLRGLVFERSASGYLQFAVFCLEALRWSRYPVVHWREVADWQWVCSQEHLTARIHAFAHSSPPPPLTRFGLSADDWQWVRSVDPRLHVEPCLF